MVSALFAWSVTRVLGADAAGIKISVSEPVTSCVSVAIWTFEKGLSDWSISKGANAQGLVVSNEDVCACALTGTVRNAYQMNVNGGRQGRTYVLSALVKGSAYASLTYWPKDWTIVKGMRAEGIGGWNDWTRVYSDVLTLPDWICQNELDIAVAKGSSGGLISEVRLIEVPPPVRVRAKSDTSLRQMKIVSSKGRVLYDSGVIRDDCKWLDAEVILSPSESCTIHLLDVSGRSIARGGVRSAILDTSLQGNPAVLPEVAITPTLRADHTFYTDQVEAQVTYETTFASITGAVAVLRFEDGDGRLLRTFRRPAEFVNCFKLPLKGVPEGKYCLKAALVGTVGSRSAAETLVFRIPSADSRRRKTHFTVKDGHFERNGKFFFPLFTWHLTPSRILPGETKAAYLERMRTELSDIAAHGFNMVLPESGDSLDEGPESLRSVKGIHSWEEGRHSRLREMGVTFADLCGVARQCGIELIGMSPYLNDFKPENLEGFCRYMLAQRDNDSIAFWHTADETDPYPDANRRRHALYQEVDPTRPTWLNVITAVKENHDAADVLSTDPYPIPGSVKLVSAHGDMLESHVGARGGRAWMLWLQDFANEPPRWTRVPTPEEKECMAFLALNHGTRGIGWFNWQAPERRDGKYQHEKSWEMSTALNKKILKHAPAFCLGRRRYSGMVGQLDVAAFDYAGKTLVCIVNPETTRVDRVTVSISGLPVRNISLPAHGVFLETIRDKFEGALRLTEPKVWISPNGGEIPYRLHVPFSAERGRNYPLVIHMHGAGSRGYDNVSQIRTGGSDFISWASSRNVEYVFLAPQCPEGKQWVDTPWGGLEHRMKKEPTPYLRMTLEIIEDALKRYPVDRSRMYVMGISMGSYATWELLQRRPDWFAGALPCCGGGDVELAARLKDVNVWAFHGDADPVVPVVRTRAMVDALRRVGGKVLYREYPGVGHDAWTPTFSDPEVFDWLWRQTKSALGGRCADGMVKVR